MAIGLLFAVFALLTLSGVLFISLFYLVAVRQLVLAGRLKRVLPLPFVNPWKVLAAYRSLLREQKQPTGAWLAMHLLLALTLLGLLAVAAFLLAFPLILPR